MAAENVQAEKQTAGAEEASMRPRRMAAENIDQRTKDMQLAKRFNEAAAHGRGKRYIDRQRQLRRELLQ